MATVSVTTATESANAITGTITVNLNAGDSVVVIECEYSTSPGTVIGGLNQPPSGATSVTVSATGTTGTFRISGLTPGTSYYIFARARTHNPASQFDSYTVFKRVSQVTWYYVVNWLYSIAYAAEDASKNKYLWKKAMAMVYYQGAWRVTRPWVKIAGVWKEVG